MKQPIVFVAVLLVAFAVTLLLLGTDLGSIRSALHLAPAPVDPPPASADVNPAIQRQHQIERAIRHDDQAVAPVVSATTANESASAGIIAGTIKTDDGTAPTGVKVTLNPPTGRLRWIDDAHFEFTDLAPGYYVVGASLEGYAPRRPSDLHVAAGHRYTIELPLDRGTFLRGTVIDDVHQRPIEGALVDFNGLAQARSGANGQFEIKQPVSPKALDFITVSHDDFDRFTYIRHPFPEPNNLTLAMTRGPGTVTGRLIFAEGIASPTAFRVRIWRTPSTDFEEVRRERLFRGTRDFEITGVFSGANVLEIEFPESKRTSRRIPFDLGYDKAKHFDVYFDRSANVQGLFVGRGGRVERVPLVLLDQGNHVFGRVETDPKGAFVFQGVAAGDYVIRIDGAIPVMTTESFAVPETGTLELTVDGDNGRIRK